MRPEAPPLPLRAASYNVHGCVGLDGGRNVERVAAVIRQLDADVVGLQEVDSRDGRAQLDALARATGMASVSGPTILTQEGDFGNAILTRLDVCGVRLVDVSYHGREPRGLVDVTLRHGDRDVRVISVHFGLRRFERAAQTEALIGQLGHAPAPLTIVCGDVNEWWPFGQCLRRLDQRLGRTPRVPSFPSVLPVLPLDGIWVEPRRALRSLVAVRGALAVAASDHLPVLAQIGPPPASSDRFLELTAES